MGPFPWVSMHPRSSSVCVVLHSDTFRCYAAALWRLRSTGESRFVSFMHCTQRLLKPSRELLPLAHPTHSSGGTPCALGMSFVAFPLHSPSLRCSFTCWGRDRCRFTLLGYFDSLVRALFCHPSATFTRGLCDAVDTPFRLALSPSN